MHFCCVTKLSTSYRIASIQLYSVVNNYKTLLIATINRKHGFSLFILSEHISREIFSIPIIEYSPNKNRLWNSSSYRQCRKGTAIVLTRQIHGELSLNDVARRRENVPQAVMQTSEKRQCQTGVAHTLPYGETK